MAEIPRAAEISENTHKSISLSLYSLPFGAQGTQVLLKFKLTHQRGEMVFGVQFAPGDLTTALFHRL